MSRAALVPLALAATAVLSAAAPAGAAPAQPTVREVTVIPLASDEVVLDPCVGPLRYTAGEVRIRLQIVFPAAGGRVVQYHAHTVGATAVNVETGVVYRDRTSSHTSNQGNPTYTESVQPDGSHTDGSHGVRIVDRVRLSAPGQDALEFRLALDVHLRRVAGDLVEPPLDVERLRVTCD